MGRWFVVDGAAEFGSEDAPVRNRPAVAERYGRSLLSLAFISRLRVIHCCVDVHFPSFLPGLPCRLAMKTRRPRLLQLPYLLFGACSSCCVQLLLRYDDRLSDLRITHLTRGSRLGQQPHSRNQFSSLHLTTEQCEATFPGLTKDRYPRHSCSRPLRNTPLWRWRTAPSSDQGRPGKVPCAPFAHRNGDADSGPALRISARARQRTGSGAVRRRSLQNAPVLFLSKLSKPGSLPQRRPKPQRSFSCTAPS